MGQTGLHLHVSLEDRQNLNADAIQGELFSNVDTEEIKRGYRGTVASKVAGITYRQLDYWARKQIVEPSITPSHGSGSRRLYSFKDVVILAVSKKLLDAGVNLQNVTAASLQALQRTSKLMDPAAYQTASDWLLQSKSIKLFGMGASGLVASDLCDKLLRIGKNAIFNFNSHVQLSYSATLTKDDTAVFISNTGKTQEILQALEAVQASGCHTIGITHYSKSPLSAGCKLLLYTSSKEVYVRSGAMSSRLAQLMVVDALFTVLASQDYAAIQGTLESSYQICMSHRVDHR